MGNKCTKKKAGFRGAQIKHEDSNRSSIDYRVFFGDTEAPKTPWQTPHSQDSCFDYTDGPEISIEDVRGYRFPFENIVLEGGGNKGLAYCGALEVLENVMGVEDDSLRRQMKRFAGASAGAMTATLYAVGYTSGEIREFLSQDLRKVFLDHSCGYLSLLPNLISRYGWNPGKKIFKWFGQVLKEKTNDEDITFQQIYDRYDQTELCIVVTNLNHMNSEYCHVKTTPDMPVRVAVRMSMTIPGMFAATHYASHGHTNIYVDGGVLCNFPIHCYDGWYLSLKPENGFLKKLQPLSNFAKIYETNQRFGTYNDKTLGFLLYACHEQDLYRTQLDSRPGMEIPQEFPKTPLFCEYYDQRNQELEASHHHTAVVEAVEALWKVLNKNDQDKNSRISFMEFEAALSEENEFTEKHKKDLSWEDRTPKQIFKAIVESEHDEILVSDLFRFLELHGVKIQAMCTGYRRRKVESFFDFLDTMQTTLTTNVKKLYMEERDVQRTVGINSVYLGTTDFNMMPEDREFLVEQGRRATLAYLRYYIKANGLKKEDGSPNSTTYTHINDKLTNIATGVTNVSLEITNIGKDAGMDQQREGLLEGEMKAKSRNAGPL